MWRDVNFAPHSRLNRHLGFVPAFLLTKRVRREHQRRKRALTRSRRNSEENRRSPGAADADVDHRLEGAFGAEGERAREGILGLAHDGEVRRDVLAARRRGPLLEPVERKPDGSLRTADAQPWLVSVGGA